MAARTSPISVEGVRPGVSRWDVLAALLAFAIVVFLAAGSHGITQPLAELQASPPSLDPRGLSWYAARTVLRMLVAMACSLLFTFT